MFFFVCLSYHSRAATTCTHTDTDWNLLYCLLLPPFWSVEWNRRTSRRLDAWIGTELVPRFFPTDRRNTQHDCTSVEQASSFSGTLNCHQEKKRWSLGRPSSGEWLKWNNCEDNAIEMVLRLNNKCSHTHTKEFILSSRRWLEEEAVCVEWETSVPCSDEMKNAWMAFWARLNWIPLENFLDETRRKKRKEGRTHD